MLDEPNNLEKERTLLFSILRTSHGENFQNLLLSESYLPWMAKVRSMVAQQERVLVLPDKLRHVPAPRAFWALSDSLDIASHCYSKSEFFKAIAVLGENTFAKEWNNFTSLNQSSKIRKRCIEEATALLGGSPNIFVSVENATDLTKIHEIPISSNRVEWRVQFEREGRIQPIEHINEYDPSKPFHVAVLITLAFFSIASRGRKGIDVIDDIAQPTPTQASNPLTTNKDKLAQSWLSEVGKF